MDLQSVVGEVTYFNDDPEARQMKSIEEKFGKQSGDFKRVCRNLQNLGIQRLFPVQAAFLKTIHRSDKLYTIPRDIYVCSSTGSGKTLAFALAIAKRVLDSPEHHIRAIILSPTRVLAGQTHQFLCAMFKGTCAKVAGVFGEIPSSEEASFFVSDGFDRQPCDIIVGTPGRLKEALSTASRHCLRDLELLVLDEVDRILGPVFADALSLIYDLCPGSRTSIHSALMSPPTLHKIAVSATMTIDPGKLSALRLQAPLLLLPSTVTVKSAAEETTAALPSGLTEGVLSTSMELKPLVLYLALSGLIKSVNSLSASVAPDQQLLPAFVFVDSPDYVTRMALLLQLMASPAIREHLELRDASIPSLRVEAAATNGLAPLQTQFQRLCGAPGVERDIDVLIVTDTLARGIDVTVPTVVSAIPPRHPNTYVHRVGRTARAYAPGLAMSLAGDDDVGHLREVLAIVHHCDIEDVKNSTQMWCEYSDMEALVSSMYDELGDECAQVVEAFISGYEFILDVYTEILREFNTGLFTTLRSGSISEDVVRNAIASVDAKKNLQSYWLRRRRFLSRLLDTDTTRRHRRRCHSRGIHHL